MDLKQSLDHKIQQLYFGLSWLFWSSEQSLRGSGCRTAISLAKWCQSLMICKEKSTVGGRMRDWSPFWEAWRSLGKYRGFVTILRGSWRPCNPSLSIPKKIVAYTLHSEDNIYFVRKINMLENSSYIGVLYIELSIKCPLQDIISLKCPIIEKCLVLNMKCLINKIEMSYSRIALLHLRKILE